MGFRRLIAVVGLVCIAGATGAVAATGAAACRRACEARNVPASCRWLTAPPNRCLHHAQQACRARLRSTGSPTCTPPPDLPGCATNHGCPFGALCADGVCQVVPCTADGAPGCAGHQTCRADRCIVGDCEGVTANCPAGLHCDASAGECVADDPGVRYCAVDTDCIAPFEPNQVCERGTCVPRRRRRGAHRRPTTTTVVTTTSSTTSSTTTTTSLPGCADVFDCPMSGAACCNQHCVPDRYAGKGICSTLYTPDCTLCTTDDDCACNGIFCDSCGGTASFSGCVDPCAPG